MHKFVSNNNNKNITRKKKYIYNHFNRYCKPEDYVLLLTSFLFFIFSIEYCMRLICNQNYIEDIQFDRPCSILNLYNFNITILTLETLISIKKVWNTICAPHLPHQWWPLIETPKMRKMKSTYLRLEPKYDWCLQI